MTSLLHPLSSSAAEDLASHLIDNLLPPSLSHLPTISPRLPPPSTSGPRQPPPRGCRPLSCPTSTRGGLIGACLATHHHLHRHRHRPQSRRHLPSPLPPATLISSHPPATVTSHLTLSSHDDSVLPIPTNLRLEHIPAFGPGPRRVPRGNAASAAPRQIGSVAHANYESGSAIPPTLSGGRCELWGTMRLGARWRIPGPDTLAGAHYVRGGGDKSGNRGGPHA